MHLSNSLGIYTLKNIKKIFKKLSVLNSFYKNLFVVYLNGNKCITGSQ